MHFENIVLKISEIVNDYLSLMFNMQKDRNQFDFFYNSLHQLLNGRYMKYYFLSPDEISVLKSGKNEAIIKNHLSSVNENGLEKKDNGVYYTPTDVCRYIIANTTAKFYGFNPESSLTELEIFDVLEQNQNPNIINELITRTYFDPTCGSGEFLVSIYNFKVHVLARITEKLNDDDYLNILKSINGNDINSYSTDICKTRLFIEVASHVNWNRLEEVVNILNENFTNYDYIFEHEKIRKTFSVIIGNPPYVEYSKITRPLPNKYGNIYADVLKNCTDHLDEDGVLGFVIPISYISTPRMKSIRKYIGERFNQQLILNFADRPDCLFPNVHQKLSILVATTSEKNPGIYTSRYHHWYKYERLDLLNDIKIIKNNFAESDFIPKVGSNIENEIFTKLLSKNSECFLNKVSSSSEFSLYLNMRATFYIKSFSYNPGSNEYKPFKFDENMISYAICLLNSSLFYFYWTITSDCWHITLKELRHLRFPEISDEKRIAFSTLLEELERRLERTKKLINSKQSEFEFKHKECLDIIDQIDDTLASIYDLSPLELDYVKNYNRIYRTGGI